jgi:probable HAF family extracellular repeat protein
MTDLGTLPGGSSSGAFGINDNGQVVGGSDTSNGEGQAFLYANGTMTDLGTLPGWSGSWAYGINDSGQVVGYYDTTSSGSNHAFLYSNGKMTDLGVIGAATCINAGGQVAGFVTTSGGGSDAFLYSNGQVTDHGALGSFWSNAEGINASGEVVGSVVTLSGNDAFLYRNGTMTDLGQVPYYGITGANGISASGQIVGTAEPLSGGNGVAFVYRNGNFFELDSLVQPQSGWQLEFGAAINDAGQIVGSGYNPQGEFHAFLLTPLTPGDANGDGRVDINDLTIVLGNFGRTGMTWSQGDFTLDGTVEINDLTIVLANFGKSSGAALAAVPEPPCAVLFGAACLLALAWRKWRPS